MKELKLKIKRVNNTTYGNPRFQILDWDNQELFDEVIETGFIKKLKKGYFTKPDSSDCYNINNPGGIIIEKINIITY